MERLNRVWVFEWRGVVSVVGGVVYEVPSCNRIFQMLLCQAQKIRRCTLVDVVVGIARGGVVPARFLADLLGAAEFATVQVEFYVDIAQTRSEPRLKSALSGDVSGKTVLLVDDIADSGKTLQFTSNYLSHLGAAEVKTATLYYKPHSTLTPDFYEKQTSRWVVFPWDLKETLRKIASKDGGRMDEEIAKLVKAGLPKALADKLTEDLH